VNQFAAAAFNKANTGGTFSGDVTVTGNLVVNGSTTTVNTATVTTNDPLIKLANNNTVSDSVDIGFYGTYNSAGQKYAGLVRQAGSDFFLFKNLTTEPTATLPSGSRTEANTGTLFANVIGTITSGGYNLLNFSQSAFNTANGANGLAAGAYNQANTNAINISIGNGINATQNTRLNSLETINTNQNTSISIIQGVDLAQNAAITLLQSIDATQNTRLNSVETVNTNQNNSINIINTQISGIQGVDATQNTRLNAVETINNNQNTAITIIQGVDNTQNTTITAVNNYAASAFAKANSAITLSANNSVLTFNQTISESATLDKGSLSVGPIVINSGVIVTVSDNSRWVVL
jgi:hypothetical protein